MYIKNRYILISILLILLITNLSPIKNQNTKIATLNIPSINLEENIFPKNSKYNNLKYGLYLLPESTAIEQEKANIIIASHSGNSKISYFKNLDQLKLNDEIKIITDKEIFLFRVVNFYEEKKDGKIDINKYDTKTLSLVTCKKNTNDLHLIVSAIYSGKLEKNA